MKKDFVIIQRLRTLGRGVKWVILIVVVVLAVMAVYVYKNLDSQLKIYVQNKLSEILPLASCEIHSAQLVPSKGIVLRGVRIAAADEFGNKQAVVEIQEAFVACQVDLQTVLSGQARPEKIILRKAILNLTLDKTGQIFGLDKISQIHSSGSKPCPLEILESDVIFSDMRKPDVSPILFSGWDFSATPPEWSDSSNLSHSPNSPNLSNSIWQITGKMTNARAKELIFDAKFEPKTKNLFVNGHVKKLLADKEYLAYLPKLPILEKSPESFQAKLDFEFQAERNEQKYSALPMAAAFQVKGTLYDGNVAMPMIVRHAASDIRLQFALTSDSLTISDLTASSGETKLQLNWQQTGLYPIRQARLAVQADDFRFDQQFLPSLASYLPEKLNEQLDDLKAEGLASIQATVTFNGQRWGIESAKCGLSRLAMTHAKFPYLLDYLNGSITIEPKETAGENGQTLLLETMTLQFISESQKIYILGEMSDILSAPFGKFEITGQNIPINDKLFAAMPPAQQEIAKSLNADGNFNAKFDVIFPGHHQPAAYTLQIAPNNCSVRYAKFPLQLKNVCGIIAMQNGNWTFNSLRAENDSAVLMGNGHLFPEGDDGNFTLNVSVNALELNKELTAAFENESHRELISGLNMSGEVNVQLKIQYMIASDILNLQFEADTNPKVTAIKPAVFPLLLDNVTCHVQYSNGNVEVRDFRGRKGNSSLCADIRCFFRPNGSWVMSLENILADRIEHDAELTRALPPDLQLFASQMQLTEPITLRGSICFQKGISADSPLCSYWNLGVICHQNNANFGVPLTNICGKVNLIGKNDGIHNTICGELELDSVNYGDYQLTNIRGPFSFHDNSVTLGNGSLAYIIPKRQYQHASLSVPKETNTNVINTSTSNRSTANSEIRQASFSQNAISNHVSNDSNSNNVLNSASLPLTIPDQQEPILLSLQFSPDHVSERQIAAKLYDGYAILSGHVFLQQGMSYRVQSQLNDINLERMTRETFAASHFKGKLSGNVELEGGKSRESVKGKGLLTLRDADIYKLPTMQKIMKLLRVRSPDDDQSTINSGDIEFKLHGNDVTLSDVKMGGSLLSLSGYGEMNLETTAITLNLGTRLGGNKSRNLTFDNIFKTSVDPISPSLIVEGTLQNGDLSVHSQTLSNVRSILNSQQDQQQHRPVRDFFKNTFGGK